MSIFREYDIRGIWEKELNQSVVTRIGEELGLEILKRGGKSIAVGYDARTHSPILFKWLCAGLSKQWNLAEIKGDSNNLAESQHLQIYDMGMIPTPVAYFSLYLKENPADSSIMITGSHNPPEYNGFKITILKKPFYGEDIRKLGEKITKDSAYEAKSDEPHITPLNALAQYKDFLINHFKHLRNFPYKVAFDCGNGVAGLALESVLKALNIPHLPLFFTPDGTFPNHHPDPSENKNLLDLKNAMKQNDIKIGIAFDGDADRIGLLTQNYQFGGDELAILFAKQMQKEGIKPLVIGEVKCSAVMYSEINKFGKTIMYKTGHSNLKVKLSETNAQIAAEMSGHIFFNDRYFGYDDAIYASLRALELFLENSVESVESFIKSLPKMFSTSEEKIESSEEAKFKIIANLAKKLQNPPQDFPKILDIIQIDGIRVVFENGWGLIRASNTTPVLVTRFEASSEDLALCYKQKMLSLLKECGGDDDNA